MHKVEEPLYELKITLTEIFRFLNVQPLNLMHERAFPSLLCPSTKLFTGKRHHKKQKRREGKGALYVYADVHLATTHSDKTFLLLPTPTTDLHPILPF